MNDLISEEKLKDWTGIKTRKSTKRWLDDRNIFYFEGKDGRICVTLSAITEKQTDSGVISFEKAET